MKGDRLTAFSFTAIDQQSWITVELSDIQHSWNFEGLKKLVISSGPTLRA